MPKKTVFFFCYRMMEFKLFLSGEILSEVTKFARLVVFVPEEFCEKSASICPDGVIVRPIRHPSFKLGTAKGKYFATRIEGLLRNIFSLTYANNDDGMPCHSQKVQMWSFSRAKTNQTLSRRILSKLTVRLASVASRFLFVRKLLQKVAYSLLVNRRHAEEFEQFRPSIVVVGSMGVDMDGSVLAEARASNVQSLVINQSWDRIVTKGYPPISPDSLIVWNDHMKSEAQRYLDMPSDAVFIEGAAPFDFLFKEVSEGNTKGEFFAEVGLDPNKTTFFFPLPSSFWHQDTLETLERLKDVLKPNADLAEKQLIVRLHPFYWEQPKMRKQVLSRLERLADLKNVYVDKNNVDVRASRVLIDRKEQQRLLTYYKHCDACVSVASTAMIEMSCMKKPVFNIRFGYWNTPNEYFPYKDYTLHHLVELQKYSAISNSDSFEDLIDNLKAFDGSSSFEQDIEDFLEREIGPNKGKAGLAFAARIENLLGDR